ncbi:MAG TPA: polyribonucleotide nucleotidyltransferase [Patescibacteria group bacterium]
MDQIKTFELDWGGRKLQVQTGDLAQQANGSCRVQYGETVVLATVCASDQPREGISYFPLLVDYEEKFYAAGMIKGSRFIKRETRPSDEAVLTARMIDRTIRPLFDGTTRNDIQVVVTTLSFDGENDPDIPALLGASIALSISDIPWDGPVAGIRIGQINGEWVINPSYEARQKSLIDIVAAGDGQKTIMLEAGAKEAGEEVVYQAIEFGQKHIGQVVKFILDIQKEIGVTKEKPEVELTEEEQAAEKVKQEVETLTKEFVQAKVKEYLFADPLASKLTRKSTLEEMKEELDDFLKEKQIGKEKRKYGQDFFYPCAEEVVSRAILETGQRVDGRALDEVRPLTIKAGVLPRTHGSCVFQRGETQIMALVTLGSPGMEQVMETIEESGKKRFMHHYNFPGYSVGEVSPFRGASRRDIGHGALAEKALSSLVPEKEGFPYTIRVVSEVLGSNGSSSMASTCASSLALMDAGVPFAKQVAGIAMGLVSDEQGNYKILTDLQDLEDTKGGMDFKIAGTADGITAIQMDTKTKGLTLEMVKDTLEQAQKARLFILDEMNKVLSQPRPELSPYAPRIISFYINVDKIRDVIGPGGKMINEIIDKTGVEIDIEQDGLVMVTSVDEESAKKAVDWIKEITREVEVGEEFEGKVVRIMDFGAFVEILPGQDGLVHISELAHYRVDKVTDVVKLGDVVKVKVVGIDEQGRINLSMKALTEAPAGRDDFRRGNDRTEKRPFRKKKFFGRN